MAEATAPRSLVVGLLADPGLPDQLAGALAEELPTALRAAVDDRVEWIVRVVQEPFEVMAGADRVIDRARDRVRGTAWDIAICLTDLPLPARPAGRGRGAVLADVSGIDGVALVSVPALGGIRLRRRARDLVSVLVAELTGRAPRRAGDGRFDPPRRPTRRLRPASDDLDTELVIDGVRGTTSLLAGLVRVNQPWQLTLGLSTALAAAATGSTFGIVYSNVWQLGAALAPWRLASTTALALLVFVCWLIGGHGLWIWGRSPLRHLLNASTVLTVGTGVLAFYAALVAVNGLAAALVVPPEHLAGVLGRPTVWTDHLRISLMASVLGLLAGAVGSGLEDDETVRRAAYGTREQERRAQQSQ